MVYFCALALGNVIFVKTLVNTSATSLAVGFNHSYNACHKRLSYYYLLGRKGTSSTLFTWFPTKDPP